MKIINWDIYEKMIAKYQQKTIENALAWGVEFEGATVLEVGGSNLPVDFCVGCLGVKKWICVDLIEWYQIHNNENHYKGVPVITAKDDIDDYIAKNEYVIIKADMADLTNMPEIFDVCISFCAFEHIYRMNQVLENIYNSLKNRGKLFTEFGPIFSCKYGSHYWYNEDSNFNNQEAILDYKHLLMDDMDLLKYLLDNYSTEKANLIHHMFLHSERINRLFYEDYEEHMKLSKFSKYEITPLYSIKVEEKLYKLLRCKYPKYTDFSTYSVRITAGKGE